MPIGKERILLYIAMFSIYDTKMVRYSKYSFALPKTLTEPKIDVSPQGALCVPPRADSLPFAQPSSARCPPDFMSCTALVLPIHRWSFENLFVLSFNKMWLILFFKLIQYDCVLLYVRCRLPAIWLHTKIFLSKIKQKII